MSLIPHSFFPRSAFDMNNWVDPYNQALSTLDVFDGFDELDNMMSRGLQWINKPDFMMQPLGPRVPQRYRIVVDCHGYKTDSIKTEIVGNQLIVTGNEEIKHEGGDFSTKQFKRTYKLPDHCESDKMVSFFTKHHQLVIEIPLREVQHHTNADLFPRIVDAPNGGKNVALDFNVPQNIAPEHVNISIKDRDLIVKAEEKVEKPDGVSRFYFYKRTTLPENTCFDQIKCNYDNNKLSITAPLNLDYKPVRHVPIEHKKQQGAIKH